MNIQLRIDELILHGFEGMDRALVGAAVEQALARLFVEQGMPSGWEQGGALAALAGGMFQVMPGAKAEQIGAQVAQAIYGGLAR